MVTKSTQLIISIIFAAILMSSCATQPSTLQLDEPVQTDAEESMPNPATNKVVEKSITESATSTVEPISPESVSLAFFNEYVQFSESLQTTLGNPEFKSQTYLSEAYLKQLDEIKAGFDGAGFDPVLKTQAIPPGPIEVSASQVAGDEAQVTIQFGKGVIDPPWERDVSLERNGDKWKIIPDRVEGGGKTAEETVQSFYNWYLDTIGKGPDFHNPLANKAYREAPFLTGRLVAEVDRLKEGDFGAGFDPFLCAQDVPEEIHTSVSFYNNGRPIVLVESNSMTGFYLTAEMIRSDFNQWAINRITCGNSPAGTAKAFYTWYLGNTTKGGELHNLWVDGSYRDARFLATEFVEMIDEMLASSEGLIADPVLQAQALPLAFDTQPGEDENTALVNLQFGESTIRQLVVEMEAGAFPPWIQSIQHQEMPESPLPSEKNANGSSWAIFTDEVYGYALRHPATWRVDGLNVVQSHTPEEFALMRFVRFIAPVDDTTADPILLEVLVGEDDLIENQCGWFEPVDSVEMYSYPVELYRSEPGLLHYVIRHPVEPEVWLIFSESLSQNPNREEIGQKFSGILETMLSTLVFRK